MFAVKHSVHMKRNILAPYAVKPYVKMTLTLVQHVEEPSVKLMLFNVQTAEPSSAPLVS